MNPLVTDVLFITIDRAEGVMRLALGEHEGAAVEDTIGGIRVSFAGGKMIGLEIPLTKVEVASWP